MDEGNTSGDGDRTGDTEGAKRQKTEGEGEAAPQIGEDGEAAGSSTVNLVFNSFPKVKNLINRNYRKSYEDDTSGAESADETKEAPSDDAPRPDSDTEDRLSEVRERNSDPRDDTSSSTIVHDTESESDAEEPPDVLKKPKPKHTWSVVPEINKRQLGAGPRLRSDLLFQKRMYGSLHCVERLELMYKLEAHEGCVNCLNFHPDGSLLASGSDDLKVVLWDWPVGRSLLSFETKHKGNIFQSKFMQLSGDLHIATCGRDGQVRLAQVSKQEGLRSTRKLGCHRGPCHKLSLLPDQPHIVISAGEDGLVFRHDVRNTRPDKILTVWTDVCHGMPLYSVSTHPLNTHEFCVCGKDHVIRVYDQRKCGTNEPTPLYKCYPKKKNNDVVGLHVTCAVYNHDGSEILASYSDDDIYIFDPTAPSGSFAHQYQGHRNGATIKGVSYFGPKSEFIVSGSDCGYVYFWEKNTEAIVQWMLADDNGVVNCLEPHPQLPFLCTSGLDWDVKVWVPSCEKKPVMAGLSEVVKQNHLSKCRLWATAGTEVSENDSMWLVWRYLPEMLERNRSRGQESSSSSATLDSDENEDEHIEGPTGCTTS